MSKLVTIPCGLSAGGRLIDVIFVHGLDGDWCKTWRHADLAESELHGWPEWLGKDIAADGTACGVHAFDYEACSTAWKGHTLPMFDRAGDFLEELDLQVPGNSRLFFICHSLGGLMVKKLLSIARDKDGTKKEMLSRTAGILFLGTPHQGSGVANIVNTVLPKLLARPTVTLEELERSNPDLRELNAIFRLQAAEHGWKVHQFAEGNDTFKVRIVDEHSADSGVGDCVVAGEEDHITLPKPGARTHKVYLRALSMLRGIQQNSNPTGDSSKGGQNSRSSANVFAWTKKEVERELACHIAVRDFLRDHTDGLLQEDANGFRLCATAGSRGFDLCSHLEQIRDNLPSFRGGRTDLDALERILGALLVLGVDPLWVEAQGDAKRAATVEFPARFDWLPLGDGHRANFLHLVASALAEGCVRLQKLFGDPADKADDRHLKPFPAETGSITETEILTALKAHFAECVLGPGAAPDVTRPADVNLAFDQAKAKMRRELKRERNPYLGTGTSYRDHAGRIRGELALTDILLLFPTGCDSEDQVLPRSMDVLCELHHIFTAIKARRAVLPA